MASLVRKLRRFYRAFSHDVAGADSVSEDFASAAKPIVVGGCGRSGTTLLRLMLDSHESICCGPESGLFLPGEIDCARLSDRFAIPLETVRRTYRIADSRAEFIDRFFATYCQLTGKTRWAEKTPKNVTRLGYIWNAFPQARFVHMIRDGRDVVCSLRTHPRHKVVAGEVTKLDTWNPIETCIERWVADVSAGRQYRTDPRYLEVRYEDLVLSTRSTLEAVLHFVGEPWDESVLHHEVTSSSRDARMFPQNPEALLPTTCSALGRWKRDLDAEDVAVFKRAAGDLLVELGYDSPNDC